MVEPKEIKTPEEETQIAMMEILTEARAKIGELIPGGTASQQKSQAAEPPKVVGEESAIESGDIYGKEPPLKGSVEEVKRARAEEEGEKKDEATAEIEGHLGKIPEAISIHGERVAGAKIEKTTREIFEEARSAYFEKYKAHLKANPPRLSHLRKILGISQKEIILPEEVEALKAQYEDSKANYAKVKYEEKEKELVRQRVDNLDEELTKYQLKDLYKELVIDERALFKQAQSEVILPKDKTRIAKLFELWDRRGRWEKLIISRSALLLGTVGYAALTGGIGAVATPGMMLFAGRKFVNTLGKGVAGAGLGMGFGVGFDATIGSYLTRRNEEAREDKEAVLKAQTANSFEYFKKASDRYDKIMQSYENRAQRKTLYKALGMMAVGAGSVRGLNWLEQSYFGAGSGPVLDKSAYTHQPSVGAHVGVPEAPARPGGISPSVDPIKSGAPSLDELPRPGALREPNFDEEPLAFPKETSLPRVPEAAVESRAPVSEILREGGAPREPESASTTEAPELSAKVSAELEKLTTVRQGEGFWQPVYRQLEDQLRKDPDGFAERYKWPYKFDKELLDTDPEYRKDILNRQTQHLLVENGKILEGGEFRFTRPGAHVMLLDNGKIVLGEGEEGMTKWFSKSQGAAPSGKPIVSDITLPAPKLPIPEMPQAPSTRFEPAPRVEYPINTRGGGMSENILDYGKPAAPPTPDEWADRGTMGERTGIYTEAAPKVPGPEFVFSEFAKNYLDHFAEYKREFSDTMLVDLAHKMRGGRITVENFWTYYQNRMGVTAMRRSVFDQMANEMKANVEKILEGNIEEKGRALTYLRTYVEAMRGKK